jgi:hypothetical protein
MSIRDLENGEGYALRVHGGIEIHGHGNTGTAWLGSLTRCDSELSCCDSEGDVESVGPLGEGDRLVFFW